MIRILLVDDQELVRTGFAMLLSAQADMEVVGQAGDGAAAAGLAATVPADVVLMDIRMPGTDGVTGTGLITARPGAPKVIVLTTFDLDEYVYAALAAGASGFLLKDARPDELLGAIRAVAAGDAVLAPSVTRRLLDHLGHRPAPGTPAAAPDRTVQPGPADLSRLDELTAREREVLVLVALGETNHGVAARLYMAESTVKTHIGNLLAKTGARDRVALVLFAFRAGLVDIADLP
ncbi:response regulator [Nakamurella sp. YIM 132087]|uniref:Response regulator n=1 Tax=Nakamurella alba TaxID=2665158 RepID=A0A7K1FLS4_9ACTN|nr:response regulator transcription factor [Nakamurella alba]MTD13844.1 response regulator [Nakamurella alba]